MSITKCSNMIGYNRVIGGKRTLETATIVVEEFCCYRSNVVFKLFFSYADLFMLGCSQRLVTESSKSTKFYKR